MTEFNSDIESYILRPGETAYMATVTGQRIPVCLISVTDMGEAILKVQRGAHIWGGAFRPGDVYQLRRGENRAWLVAKENIENKHRIPVVHVGASRD
jgi:hypothetical protein